MKFLDANYIPYQPNKWLSFDDVSLVPKMSPFDSRNHPDISIKTKFLPEIEIPTPIISAPMDTVTELNMASTLFQLGGVGIFHRYYKTPENRLAEAIKFYETTKCIPSVAIGLAKTEFGFISSLLEKVPGVVLCLDVAHGHMESVFYHIKKLIEEFTYDKVRVIAGSICTPTAAVHMITAGASALRVGVGCGSACTTRVITGHGTPQLTTIMQIRDAINGLQSNATIIADGGIRNSGDIVKALAAGADTVMIGRLFAGTDESPFITNEKGERIYRGQASRSFMEDNNKSASPEGVSFNIHSKGSVKQIFNDLIGGIRSGMSYAGTRNFKDLYEKSHFIEITTNSYIEGTPHGIKTV